MNNPIEFMREDYCMECNSEKSIELYDIRNRVVGYSNILDNPQSFNDVINNYELSYFKCKKCGASWGIFWLKPTWFPIPFMQMFILNNFEENYLKKGK